MSFISNLIIPIIVIFILIYGLYKKTPIYDEFINGASETFQMIIKLFPCLVAMILGINIFLKSGVLNLIYKLINPLFELIKIPVQVLPMMIMRPISGSSTLAILNNLFLDYGPDSLIGRIASVIQGSTETTLYVITLYFGSVGIKKIKYALYAGLFADLVGIIASVIIVKLFFYW